MNTALEVIILCKVEYKVLTFGTNIGIEPLSTITNMAENGSFHVSNGLDLKFKLFFFLILEGAFSFHFQEVCKKTCC